MKIAIVTQPLLNNYGGVIQNYALQKILVDLGHVPITLDCRYKPVPWWIYLLSWLKTLLCLFIPGKKRPFAKVKPIETRLDVFESFITKHISTTIPVTNISSLSNIMHNMDAFVVGSDQVWRPKYAPDLGDAFLRFLKSSDVRRISYAASFGVDYWEYSSKQTKICSKLARKFNAISVREESGVKLCKENFGVDATWVLDPTLLLKKEDYAEICKDVHFETKQVLAAYVLNIDDSILKLCKTIAKERGLELKFFSADTKANLSIPEWLAMFRDASYVITDSFHGTVFSIIFGKEFKCLYNETRGSARFESLLNLYNSGKLEEMRQFSLNWLKDALES
ncbi:polysaccharide pyruvyl transferase family protein [uncultured Fibrobacter sp.]|uniref:polysaccharide pyruvyl transferase family protein n=1 Tax=uncultured Fibrobacter sp. TaxID=261512 RepID=UPI00260A864A|nr:polysaccharide pyruvyl transferase family protein [uncultured Fibrobacter sp.]